jgi:GNAT superfamily N-acetyltransferase
LPPTSAEPNTPSGYSAVIKNDDTIARKPDDFEVSWVFGNILPALRRQLVTFWLREGALTNPDEAWRRSWEVACVLRQVANGSIAGACTVAIRLDDQGHAYGFIRIFIRPGSRLAGLNVRLMKKMIEGFEGLAHEQGAPRRLLATIENRKLERRAIQQVLASLGFVHAGRTADGELMIHRPLR